MWPSLKCCFPLRLVGLKMFCFPSSFSILFFIPQSISSPAICSAIHHPSLSVLIHPSVLPLSYVQLVILHPLTVVFCCLLLLFVSICLSPIVASLLASSLS